MLSVLVTSALLSLEYEPFRTVLPIPPILEDENPETPEMEITLTAGRGKRAFFRDVATPTLGYNGDYLGPTIRVEREQKVLVRLENQLDEVTTLHWHGLHVPGEMDGGPHQTIDPGEVWLPHFAINQPAATLWYHPHALGKTGKQVYSGMAGLFIIDDEESGKLGLPDKYGVTDIPLIIQDRRFDANGAFVYVRSMPDVMHGVIGNYILVNGVIKPFVETTSSIVRFRILNGSNASLYRISFDENTFMFIASDGGFIEKPIAMGNLVLSPGERAEVLLDLSAAASGEEILLRVEEYNGATFDAMKIRVISAETNTSVPRIDEIDAVRVWNMRIPG